MSARVGLFSLIIPAFTWVTFEALGDGELKSSNANVLTTRFNQRRAAAVTLIDNTGAVAPLLS